MINYPLPANEKERLEALQNYQILDTLNEQEFDRITELAAIICDVPISTVTLIDHDRQWFKSSVGLTNKQTARDLSFCQYTIMDTGIFEITDATQDERFKDNELVTGDPNIKFYAGYPLIDPDGYALGSLCVIDRKPKVLTDSQKRALTLLSQEVTNLIVERRLKEELKNFELLFELSNDLLFIGGLDGYFKKINPAFTRILGWSEDYLLKTISFDLYHPDDVKNTQKELEKLGKGKKTINFLQRIKTSKGKYKTIQWTSTPEPETGNIFGIGRDVSDLKLKEQQLAASEEKLRVFFENSLGIMLTHDKEGRILSVNNAGAGELGYTKSELIGKKLHDIMAPERLAMVDEYLNRVLAEGTISGLTTTLRKDGSKGTWMYNNVLEKGTGGEPYVIVNGMDITERHHLERELQRTTQMLEKTNQVARVGGWDFDVINKKIYWSSVTREIHQVSADFEPDLASGINFYKEGESREKITAAITMAVTTGKGWDEELQLVTARGDEIWVRAQGEAEFDGDVCVRLYGTFQDIDVYKYGELALKRSIETQEKLNAALFDHIEMIEEQDKTIEKIQEFKFLADSIPQIVWTAESDGKVNYYNQHWVDYTGRSLEEVTQQGWSGLIHPDDVDTVMKTRTDAIAAGKPYQVELRLKRKKDGLFKWHIARAVPMKDDRGKITKWFGSATDIDEYKRALDLENRISQFEDFNRIVAHNLRGPAGSIDMMLEMIGDSETEEERDNYITLLKKSSASLKGTLDELMKVLEIRNNSNLPNDDCNLEELTHGVEQMLAGQIISKKAIISKNFQVTNMMFPKMYLESIFYNMISNSLKYSKADVPAEIDIISKSVNGRITLIFKDNGIGIDLERHGNNVFKLNKTFHTGYDSKGIGLFMTKTQIETFGGHISVESVPDEGTTFTIVF